MQLERVGVADRDPVPLLCLAGCGPPGGADLCPVRCCCGRVEVAVEPGIARRCERPGVETPDDGTHRVQPPVCCRIQFAGTVPCRGLPGRHRRGMHQPQKPAVSNLHWQKPPPPPEKNGQTGHCLGRRREAQPAAPSHHPVPGPGRDRSRALCHWPAGPGLVRCRVSGPAHGHRPCRQHRTRHPCLAAPRDLRPLPRPARTLA